MITRFAVRNAQHEPEIQTYCDLHDLIYYRGLTTLGWALIVSIDSDDSKLQGFRDLWDWAVMPVLTQPYI